MIWVKGSIYQNCGRFEGIAYGRDATIGTANYAKTLEGAEALVKERHPFAKRYEVVEHEYNGHDWRVFKVY